MAQPSEQLTMVQRLELVATDGSDPPADAVSCTREIIVLRVTGQLDVVGIPVVMGALDGALERRASYLVVDLAALSFCLAWALAVLVDAGRSAAALGTVYAISGASPQVSRLWQELWSEDQLPLRFPDVATAMIDAMTRFSDRCTRIRPTPRSVPPPRSRTSENAQVERFERTTDAILVKMARAGDEDAHRALGRLHRRRMFRSALQTLGASDDPGDLAHDIAGQLHRALSMRTWADNW
jgi:anti-anti-sigma factor